VPDELTVRPVITGTAEIRRASSSCCGAKLDLARVLEPGEAPADEDWLCRKCGNACARVMGEPEEVTLHG